MKGLSEVEGVPSLPSPLIKFQKVATPPASSNCEIKPSIFECRRRTSPNQQNLIEHCKISVVQGSPTRFAKKKKRTMPPHDVVQLPPKTLHQLRCTILVDRTYRNHPGSFLKTMKYQKFLSLETTHNKY